MMRLPVLGASIALSCAPLLAVAASGGQSQPAQSCAADADVQQLTGAARAAFLNTCGAGRTPPIAGTANAPLGPTDPAEICNARAVGAKMTGEARQNYVADCEKKAGDDVTGPGPARQAR